MLKFVCSLPNPDTRGAVRHKFSNDDAQLDAFAQENGGFGKGVYDCIGLFNDGERIRKKDTVVALPIVICDLDLKNIEQSREQVLKVLDELALAPTETRDSGNGLHAVWVLKEHLTGDDMARGERVMKRFTGLLAGDPLPTHRAALLRRPGTANTKGGHERPCRILVEHSDPTRVYDITEIEEMLDLYEQPLLNLKESVRNDTHVAGNSAVCTFTDLPKGPIDVEQRLADMEFGSSVFGRKIHTTQLQVSCALTFRGFRADETIERILTATREAVDRSTRPDAKGWDWDKERYEIEKMTYDLVDKAMKENGEDISHVLPDKLYDRWQEVISAGMIPTLSGGNGCAWHVRGYPKKERSGNGASLSAAWVGNGTGNGAAEQPTNIIPLRTVAGATADTIRLKSIKASDFDNIPARQYLYGYRIQRKKLSATIAKGGTGKTTKKVAEAIAMATCRDILGIQPAARLKAWVHSGEDDADELRRKIKATCQYFKIPLEELEGWLFVTSGEELPLKVANGYNELKYDNELIARIKKTIIDNEIDVFIADPLITLHGAPENDNGKMDQVMRILIGVATTCDCAVDISHHIRKGVAGSAHDASADDGRGASSIHDAVRYMEVLNVMSKDDGEQFGFDEFARLSYFRSDQGKANLAPAAKKAHWFKIENIELDNGDSVGVVIPWARPDEGTDRDTDLEVEAMFLDLLSELFAQDRFVQHATGHGYAPKVFAGHSKAKKRKFGKKAFEAAMERLFDAGMIEVETYGPPSKSKKRLRRQVPSPPSIVPED
jgi:RecA-family ATPase